MKTITVVAAIWKNENGEYFIAQRGASQSLAGYWEFPGGKLEEGEKEPDALARELKEELNIEVNVGSFIAAHQHKLDEQREILLKAYELLDVSGDLLLKEHQDVAWVKAKDLLNYSLSPADIPIAQLLK
jgi:(d)CTP diphosphatase